MFIEGIELLNTTVISQVNGFAFLIATGVVMIIGFIFSIIFDIDALPVLSVVVALVCGTIFGYIFATEQTQYDVTISDNVSFEEFDKRYEIIEQKGKIYTIVMKEQEEE